MVCNLTMTVSDTICLVACITRRSDLTEEQFLEHWRHKHAPLIVPWAIKYGIITYSQVCQKNPVFWERVSNPSWNIKIWQWSQIHTPKHVRSQFQSLSAIAVDTLEFDGVAEWRFPSLEMYLKAFSDPYYTDVIEPDEHNFLDKTRKPTATLTMGYYHQILIDKNSTAVRS